MTKNEYRNEYRFDYAHPEAVPDGILPALEAHGVLPGEVSLLVRADLNDGFTYGDVFVFFAGARFCVLSGTFADTAGGKRYIERSFRSCCQSDLSGFRVEDQASICMLTAEEKGKKIFVCCAGKTLREDLTVFAGYANELTGKGAFTPDPEGKHERKELFCPKCGLRYADPDAKICPKCMKRTGVVRRTFALFREYRARMFLILLALIAGGAAAVIAPYLSGEFLYEKVLSNAGSPYYGKLLFAVLAIVATRVLSIAVNSLHGVLSARLAADMEYKLRRTIFSSINRLSLSFFTSRRTGGLMTQVDNDAETIYWFFCDVLPEFALYGAQILAITVIMFLINPILALAAVCVLPAAVLIAVRCFKKMDVLHTKRFTRKSSLSAALSDMLGGIRVVKAFSGEEREKKRFDVKNRDMTSADLNASLYNARVFPLLTLIMRLGTVFVWAVGGVMILMKYRSPGLIGESGILTYGMLATFLSYVSLVYDPLFAFAEGILMTTDSLNAMGRLIEIMDAQPEVKEKENAVDLPAAEGRVTFEDVGFSYTPGVTVLEKVGFDVEAGKTVGIVGRTGAGKSTLMHLLTRMYDPTEGRILIDGADLKDLSFGFLRRNIAIVSQDTYLFSGTVMDNVRYARPDATPGEVMDACVAAGANEFIMKLRDGYDTKIGQGYADLSGGEKQRLSIARAILTDPKILILDEATSAMDTRTEQMIQRSLETFMKGRTTLMIAHRLSTLRIADELIVLDKKRVCERGTPKKLIKDKGLYYELYKLQVESMKNIGVSEED